ncbi:MAG TPA: hypothetical protein DCS97_12045, partial [Planctomycetes bacterium]|nr:hypothetical protein [Planctomycetota bacterium]
AFGVRRFENFADRSPVWNSCPALRSAVRDIERRTPNAERRPMRNAERRTSNAERLHDPTCMSPRHPAS